jgi:hypothetical protein
MKCDYCGFFVYVTNFLYKAGDTCMKCKKGTMCEKGSRGNP